ncbi:MAG TPA: MerR family transcriptional regulator [Ktedonobacterales bacterium]|nr:MerR family transcriptional regulator [Ktedonobacterales bacterium]
MEQTYTIQEVAERTGISIYTLRYYEHIGLIHPIGRLQNSHRRYSDTDIGWIEFLLKLRSTGMPIQQMRAYAELQRRGDGSVAERIKMLKAHQQETEAHIRQLTDNLALINHKIQFYEGELAARAASSTADQFLRERSSS